ncbi:glucose-6-phosphate isomerase [Candidatus Pelagibacter sp.]|nr:glucose-6-phosphate isomerase [Candidatus Pelagibacter sp.]
MILSNNIIFRNFKEKRKIHSLNKILNEILQKKNEILKSMTPDYKYSFSSKLIKKFKKFSKMRIIGMGGSILGTKAIYSFLNLKIKKKVEFVDNLLPRRNLSSESNLLNLVVSKSGNTLETISNVNILVKKNQKKIFIVENNDSYLRVLGNKMRAEVIDHNNYIGGRYSVLSEVGMLPASLLGLEEKKFKQLNNLIKNKNFMNLLIRNVSNIIFFLKNKKYNSVILNYDQKSEDFFLWYQQLVGESLGKKQKGIYPLISKMPRDNHSLMQLYLDGPRNNFFTIFNFNDKKSNKLNNKSILKSHNYLKNKTLTKIINSQKEATEKVFQKKKIPFRSFEIKNRNEATLGELFTFFVLETIMIGKALKINPYNQPSVELIKVATKDKLIKF